MRFVWAVAAFVLAAVMIATGIAARTVFQGPKIETSAVEGSGTTAYTLIDGHVLNRMPGSQTLRAAQEGTIFAAYGRTDDMKAWLADSEYTAVTLGDDGSVDSAVVAPTQTGADAEPAHRNPAGSDLWLDEFEQDDILIQHLQLPDTMSVLVATDGTKPAPAEISLTWPLQTSTPWAGPLIVGGGILMAVGVFLYILGLRRLRRSRGPRRKALPPLPETESIDLSVSAADKGVISAGRAQKAATGRRRGFVIIPVLAVSSLLFAGCSADAWPQFGGTPSPTPTQTVVDPEGAQSPAVTPTQADRILSRVSTTVAKADEKKDGTLAATRLAGAALAERKTNYTLRGKISTEKALPAVPATGVELVLPQAYEGWPRTVMLIAEHKSGDKVSSTMMMLAQQDAWSPYKLAYSGQLEAAKLPEVAPAYVGAAAVQPDSSFLVMAPGKIAAAYADVMDKGDKSASAGAFDTENDVFLKGVEAKRKEQVATFNKTASKTGSLAFAAKTGSQKPVALATLESGAIVAVNVDETETVKPTNKDAVIKLDDNPRVKALTGVKESATGFTTTYSDQLFFYVPGVGAGDAQIRLLGYASNILGAKVVSK
ncbi:glycosyl transferase [Microbacterium elymi]|uniref:Glycosyl transferase n=1 Tax=Microbacterium elymi TaxID=2909587 RepID=A0ABY5NJX5_9MICO|nr:glycosyl transferase [Microbacterium elymi]UUT35429.1 glycosyl transferase [Microbacterium elymi]